MDFPAYCQLIQCAALMFCYQIRIHNMILIARAVSNGSKEIVFKGKNVLCHLNLLMFF